MSVIGHISYPEDVPAARRAAERLAGDMPQLCARLELQEKGEKRWFEIVREGKLLVFRSNRAAGLLAAVGYLLNRRATGHEESYPVVRVSPFPERLIMEDFPFGCYWSTGFDFDTERYAENLAELGFTAMECNRFSRRQPMEPYHWMYLYTNPSPAMFVWTPWHEGCWSREEIESNACELDRTVASAISCGLEPTFTCFLPRPYPESFFKRHPQLRGECYDSVLLKRGGHEPEYRINTDSAEGKDFYRTVIRGLLERWPQWKHFFFWHGDLGSGFYPDGEGPACLRQAERIAAFHKMLRSELNRRNMQTNVWLNPWKLGADTAEELARILPEGVHFSIKDNPGLETFAGTSSNFLPDATIVFGELGDTPKRVLELASRSGRKVCLGQYQDFSEDLDPIPAVPHPWRTLCKFKTLQRLEPEFSAVHWGVLSPDIAPVNPNREVIRELNWGGVSEAAALRELLVPAAYRGSARQRIFDAWRKVDAALKLWPQFWGMRLQDSGVRLRLLTTPFAVSRRTWSREELKDKLSGQIYRIAFQSPGELFMELTPGEMLESGEIYAGMAELVMSAVADLRKAAGMCSKNEQYAKRQADTLLTLGCFWRTYANIFQFYGLRDLSVAENAGERNLRLCGFVTDELDNLAMTISHLEQHPETLVIAGRGRWGQCFGPDYLKEFKTKQYLMSQEAKGQKKRNSGRNNEAIPVRVLA
ncbi:hypothetical protein KH017_06735 [bacterium]|nr:hypothetical protein [bacterium]